MTDTQTRDRSAAMLEALQLWRDITGVDPNARTLNLGDWSLRETFEELEEAIALDPTEITALLLFNGFVKEYLGDRTVPLLALLESPDTILQTLAKPRRLLEILNTPDIAGARDAFLAALANAAARYEAGARDDVGELLARSDDIALLRRDALRSMQQLRVDQFLDGLAEPAGTVPIYNRTVHQWWNINSLLAAATRMPSGVSLNLIRDPDAFQSYFCFAIRTGGNLFILSDIPENKHPLQGSMRRRPDRVFAKRADRNWFPYELLDLEYDAEARRLFEKQRSSHRALVAYQHAALPLKPMAELDAPNLIWIAMMFDLIVERFWRQGYKAPALSYTAEMLHRDTVLIEAAQSANLPVPAYQPMGLPPLTLTDIGINELGEETIGRRAHANHDWMEARYGHQVSTDALNLVAGPETTFVIACDSGEISAMEPSFQSLTDWQRTAQLAGRRQIEKVAATTFGSREQLEKDRRFIARYNYATQIDALAKAEYVARKEEILQWYRRAVEANSENLLRWAGNDALWVDDGLRGSFSHYEGAVGSVQTVSPSGERDTGRITVRSLIDRYTIGSDGHSSHVASSIQLGDWQGSRALCFLNGTRASYYVIFAPATAEELALLAGCTVDALPDVLQQWTLVRPYEGNSILDRVDPMIWNAHNPWQKLNLRVRIALSKRGLAKIAPQTSLPPVRNLFNGTVEHS